MLQNPYSPTPSKAAAWNEGFSKGFASSASPSPSAAVSADDTDAFNDGVSAGLDAQTNGIDLGLSCIEAADSDESTETADSWLEGGERLSGLAHALTEMKVGAFFEAALTSIVLTLIVNPLGTQAPDQVLPALQQPLIDSLASMGLDNFALFCGIGVDPTADGCQFKATPFFRTQDAAQSAATALGRPTTTVVSWRTDQCGSFSVVA